MDLKHHIGLRVKAARTQAGLTQARLAERVDRAVETISNIERGHALPGLDLLSAIAEVTAAPLTSFVEGFGRTRKVSPARLTLEEQIREAQSGRSRTGNSRWRSGCCEPSSRPISASRRSG